MRANSAHYWGVILAGGEGSRLQEFTKHLYGKVRPKQFCVFAGTRSMFRHTLDRTLMLIPSQRILTVICKQYLEYATDQVRDVDPRNVVLLPFCKETAASVLYSLLLISRRDPDAVVALFPSDHFVRDERDFMQHVLAAFDCVRQFQGDLVVLGVDAGYPETEYGWVELADRINWDGGAALFRVRRFWEKPHEE
ncbi:MAG TPA: sugar phosphate nucleotidyltransferase, partial [Bacteroidota bacterium]